MGVTAPTQTDSASRDPEGEVFYGEQDGVLFIRLVGVVRYTNCGALSDLVASLFDGKTYEQIIIDLRRAESIDSTNLGILAKIAKHTESVKAEQPILVCNNPEIRQIITSMGLDKVYDICLQTESCCKVYRKLEGHLETSDTNLNRVMLDAHQELAVMNDENREAFEDVIKALKGDL